MRCLYASLCNKLDAEVVDRAHFYPGPAMHVSLSRAAMAGMGLREGEKLRVINTQNGKWTEARAFISERFERLGLARAVRQALDLELDPRPSSPGLAPMRGLSLKLTPFQYDWGISYSRADGDYARALVAALTRRGVSVFFDEAMDPLDPAENLSLTLAEAYRDKTEWCAALVSARYLASRWTARELECIRHGRFIRETEYLVPVLLEDVPPERLAELAAPHNVLDARRMTPDEVGDTLARRLAG
jgi:hypothetical protein